MRIMLVMVLSTCLIMPSAAIGQSSSQEARRLVTWQVETDFAVDLPTSAGELIATTPEAVTVDDAGLVADGITVWRLTPQNITHPSSYLIGVHGARLLRLGGFEEVELIATGRALGAVPLLEEAVHSRTLLLSRLADPNGGVWTIALQEAQSATSAQLAAVLAVVASAGASDTVIVTPSGAVAKVTLITAQRSVGTILQAMVFTARFDDRGDLVAWSRRVLPPAPEGVSR